MATLFWIAFLVLILVGVTLDLGVFNKTPHVPRTREALGWTGFWVPLAMAFAVLVYYIYENNWTGIGITANDWTGAEAVTLFLTGYLVEYSLSLDNIVVIALIFTHFRVPLAYQHRVLFWGVLGALVLRFTLIVAGAALITRFWWVTYIFGGFLIFSAARMLVASEDELEPEKNVFVRLAERFFPVHDHFHGHQFFVEMSGRRYATRLFIVLLLVESSDVIFAVDSIPAIFAITTEPFIVFTSNVFAILGLRSLYFALAPLMDRFRYLKMSLVFLLAFVGVKLIVAHHVHIPPPVTLAAILGILAVGGVASVIASAAENRAAAATREPAPGPARGVSLRTARRLAVLLIGGSVVAVGVAMLALPGPAFVVIPAGLAILATEFVWARRILRRLRESAENAVGALRGNPRANGPEPAEADRDARDPKTSAGERDRAGRDVS
jgi:tellurite resistance protein TerC